MAYIKGTTGHSEKSYQATKAIANDLSHRKISNQGFILKF